jgi:class 3 adenylate cyclase
MELTMANFDNMFEDLFSSLDRRSVSTAAAKSISMESKGLKPATESFDSLPLGPQEEFILQKQIRPIFGKGGVNSSSIGAHPDFIDLEGTARTQKHYACTIFVDIKGSTRLSLLYPLDFVYKFKNAVIQACVEVVRSFDGHVHRIMGDAVMAFFGGSSTGKEDAIADAINCSITLRTVLERSIRPWMEKKGLDAKDFGFRVGCDFGDDNEVLWGSYGYVRVGEVSATGLPVDMASKLQSLAGKNETMLGRGILDFVNWPEKYLLIKTQEKDGKKTQIPFVTPNITYADGSPINYKMRELYYRQCLEFSALPRSIRGEISGGMVKDHPDIEYKCFTVVGDSREEYISASKFLEPDVSLKFEVSARTNSRLMFPLKVIFRKTNHGPATPEDERDIEQQGVTFYLRKNRISQYNKSYHPISRTELSEGTLYRGLHTMKCEVYDSAGTLQFRDWIGVLIK